MSIKLMSMVWDQHYAKPTEKLLMLAMADQASDEGYCWPSVNTIARRVGVKVRQVQYLCAGLEERGLLVREYRKGRSSVFQVRPEMYTHAQDCTPAAEDTPALDCTTPMHPDAPPPCTPLHHTPALDCTQNRNRNQIETKHEPTALSELKAREQDECRAIWREYSLAYINRYQTEPVRNAKVNSIIRQLRERLGADAPWVAGFYADLNDPFFVTRCHDLGLLLSQCEAIRTRWATGMRNQPGRKEENGFLETHFGSDWAAGLPDPKPRDESWRDGL